MKRPVGRRGAILFSLLVLTLPSTSLATVRHVPAEYPAIQAAVNASSVGDTILVAPGTYFENVVIDRRVALVSEAGAEVTTIDGRNLGSVVFVQQQVDHAAIDGFRVTHGRTVAYAGGIEVRIGSSIGGYATIRRNIVEYNNSIGGPGGISSGRHSIIEDNIIQYNNGPKGFSAMEASGTIERNVIRGNEMGLYNVLVNYTDTFAWNIVVDNRTGRNEVVFIGGGSIHHNTFNADWFYPAVELWSGSPYDFHNNLIVHGMAGGLDCHLDNGSHTIGCNDVWGEGKSYLGDCADLEGSDGNFSADPLFCDASNGDYRLSIDSPCAAPAGCGLIGALDVGCGILTVNESATAAMPRLVFAPNPVWAGGGAYLTGVNQGNLVDIYDIDGRVVDIIGPVLSSPFQWYPDRQLPSGVYFARTRGSSSPTTARFVLVR